MDRLGEGDLVQCLSLLYFKIGHNMIKYVLILSGAVVYLKV